MIRHEDSSGFAVGRLLSGLWLGFLGLLLAGCASSTRVVDTTAPALLVPAGVDSAVAIESDSMASKLFVSLVREEKAQELKETGQGYIQKSDSLWRYLTMKRGEKQISDADSLEGVRKYNEGAAALIEYSRLADPAGADSAAVVRMRGLQRLLLDRAQQALEKAIVLNPYDLEARNLLAIVYRHQADRLSRNEMYARAAEVLERLVRIDRGQHALFASLGRVYYAMREWQPAYDNFRQAEEVLLATAYQNTADPSAVDTTAWFTYAFYEGYAQTNLRRAQTALQHLRQALTLARSEEQQRTVQSVIDWINWDDGNIAASEARDQILQAVTAGDYAEAESGFRDLLDKLRTPKAREEIEWRLALVEYQLDKRERAIERLKRVVDRLATIANRTDADTLSRLYFEDYGTMAFNLGGWYLKEKRDRRTAFTYFVQASKVAWTGKGKAYLELAKFAQNDPPTAVRYGEQALAAESPLSQHEKKQVYALLAEMYKRMGQFDLARKYYRLWTQN